MTWNELKPQLFQKMEQRRTRQAMFHVEQIYSFTVGCSKQFNTAKRIEAQEALNRIQDEGTFLLAAESFSEFQLMLYPESQSPEPEPASADSPTDPNEGPLPRPERDFVPHNRRQVAQPSQPATDTRRGSGQPFRR